MCMPKISRIWSRWLQKERRVYVSPHLDSHLDWISWRSIPLAPAFKKVWISQIYRSISLLFIDIALIRRQCHSF